MPKKKRAKYNAGGLKFTQKLGKNVKLDLSLTEKTYEAGLQTSRGYVSAEGSQITKPPSRVTAGAHIPGTRAMGTVSKDFNEPGVNLRAHRYIGPGIGTFKINTANIKDMELRYDINIPIGK